MSSVLTLVTFVPTLGALAVLLLPRRADGLIKVTALGASLVTFLLSVPLFTGFNAVVAEYQFEIGRASCRERV